MKEGREEKREGRKQAAEMERHMIGCYSSEYTLRQKKFKQN